MVKNKKVTQSTLNTAMVDISSIKITGLNPRKEFDKKLLQELAQSISEMGILEPLIVRQKGDTYELVSGERRLRAAKMAELKQVPVWIREVADAELQEIMILENLQRESLTPLEEGMAIASMVEGGAVIADLAKKLGKSDNWVRGRINLLLVPEEMKNILAKGKMPISAALDLVPFAGSVFAEKVVATLVRNHYNSENPYTQDSVKRAMDDIIGKEPGPVLNFSKLKNNYVEWHKHFDKGECAKCPKKTKYTHGYRGTSEICVDKECFGPKVKAAKLKMKDKKEKTTSKSTILDLNNARNYEDLNQAKFSISVCSDCSAKKQGVRWGSKMTVCMNQSCYRAMDKKAQDMRDQRVKTLGDEMDKAGQAFTAGHFTEVKGIPGAISKAILLALNSDSISNAARSVKRTSDKWKKNKEDGLKFFKKLTDAELEIAMVKVVLMGLVPEREYEVRNTALEALKLLPEIYSGIKYDETKVKVEPTGKKETKAEAKSKTKEPKTKEPAKKKPAAKKEKKESKKATK